MTALHSAIKTYLIVHTHNQIFMAQKNASLKQI